MIAVGLPEKLDALTAATSCDALSRGTRRARRAVAPPPSASHLSSRCAALPLEAEVLALTFSMESDCDLRLVRQLPQFYHYQNNPFRT